MKQMVNLEICIPTYNRPEQIANNLNNLLEIKKEIDFNILVIDNASTKEWIKKIDKESLSKIKVINNPVNIGGQANVIRCFEESKSDYLWIIGDDDYLTLSSIKKVITQITEKTEVDVFNFRCNAPGHKIVRTEYIGKSRINFIKGIGNLNALYYVVGYVYKRKKMIPSLRFAYLRLNYFCPHLAMILAGENLQFYVSNVSIHNWTEETKRGDTLSPLPLLLNIPSLLAEAKNIQEFLLLHKYIRLAKRNFLSPIKLIFIILGRIEANCSRLSNLKLLISYIGKNEIKVPSLVGLFSCIYILAFSPFPKIYCKFTRFIVNYVSRTSKRNTNNLVYSDSNERL
jgi:glycosyltransferase involved in cell wall biosynthesis